MRHRSLRRGVQTVALGAAALLAGATLSMGTAQAAPPTDTAKKAKGTGDNPEHPLPIARKKAALKKAALERRLQGDTAMNGRVARVGKGQYVELQREADDPVFVLLVQFGDERYPDPRFADDAKLMDPQPQKFAGPSHNQIPRPDRRVDNTTLWKADYNPAHYQDMYFTRMANYYKRQSSNRYSVHGEVNGWVTVPFNEALYGRNYCGDIVCNTSKALIRDALAEWVQQQLTAGKSATEIADYLKKYDVWDRYDLDGDGNFNEPDGYLDHMQLVHAGGDEAASDPTYGSDAIWSHRSYANLQAGGPAGLPGIHVGTNTGLVSSDKVPNNPIDMWVGDYTIQPENGGLGVFAHEYGHDLGLPDLYDTSGNTGGAENSTAFWSLMSSGANIGTGSRWGIGDAPTDLSAWELFQLGWLNQQGDKGPFYEVATQGERSTHRIGKNVPATKEPQAVFTVLKDKEVPLALGAPAEGTHFFWSTQGNDLNTSMTATVSGASLTAKVRYEIETEWDYAFLEASSDGSTWTPVRTNLSDVGPHTGHDQSGFNTSDTGMTGTKATWTDLTATLPEGTTQVRFRYQTDAAAVERGFMVDSVSVGGTAVAEDAWKLDGFVSTTGSEIQKFFNAYVLENRQYDGYDASLRTAYNFGFLDKRPDWVETYRYQDGLLIWYWDESYTDNNVGDHPGAGLVLPVDAHPTFHHYYDGQLMRQRILSYDSTFGRERTDTIVVHKNSRRSVVRSQPGVRTFDDTRTWWYDCDRHACTGAHDGRYQPGWTGVKVPNTGTTITVNSHSHDVLAVTVAPKKVRR